MCGRYTLTNPDPAGFRARFGIDESVELERRGAALQHRANRPGAGDSRARRRRARAGPAALGAGAGPVGRAAPGPPLINARAETLESSRPSRVVSRAALPDPRRRVLRVAERRARQDADLVQPARRRPVRVRRASGRSCRRAAVDGVAAQLRDRHLRAERARSARSTTGCQWSSSPSSRRAWLDPEAGEEELLALLVPAPEERSSRARSATSSTTCVMTARTDRAGPRPAAAVLGRSRARGAGRRRARREAVRRRWAAPPRRASSG